MAGVSQDYSKIYGIEILDSQETPGLGQEITSAPFRRQFKGLSARPAITYVKGKPRSAPNQIEAITGATISSKAVVSMLNKRIYPEKLKEIRMKLKNHYYSCRVCLYYSEEMSLCKKKNKYLTKESICKIFEPYENFK